MSFTLNFLFFASLLGLASQAQASVGAPENRTQCINGDVGKNKSLLASFDTNKDPLRLAFQKTQNQKTSEPAPEPQQEYIPTLMTDIETCFQTNTSLKNYSVIRDVTKHLSAINPKMETNVPTEAQKGFAEVAKQPSPKSMAPKIKRECIEASMTRSPGNDGYTCSYPPKGSKHHNSANTQSILTPYGTAGGNSLQCINDRMVDYMTFAVNNAIQCMSPNDPVDARVIFKKINNETAFNPSLASRGGVGIGQMTSPAKNELTDKELGRGRYILENIVDSKKPECEGFKNVAQDDLKKAPRIGNSCEWVSTGNGLARSLMYTVGYYLTMRDQYVIPSLERRSPHLIGNASLISDFTAIAYGAEGLDHAKWLMQKYRAGKGSNLKDLQDKIRRDSVYLSNIKGKMKEITCIRNGVDPTSKKCENHKFSTDDLEADSCVTK